MEQNMIFGLILGRLAVLKIWDWALKYATFEGNFLMFSWAKKTSPRDLCIMTLLTCSKYSACSSIMYLAYNGDSKERKKGGNN